MFPMICTWRYYSSVWILIPAHLCHIELIGTSEHLHWRCSCNCFAVGGLVVITFGYCDQFFGKLGKCSWHSALVPLNEAVVEESLLCYGHCCICLRAHFRLGVIDKSY